MTQFPWKIIRNGQEIYFPEGARRFVSVSVEQIGGDGRLDRAIDASAIFLGDAAFRLHAVTLSCQGHTVAPVFDVWPGQQVTLECPVEFAVPGPSAVLAYDPVAGSVYGVDEDDNRLAATVVGRNVTSAGAVAIRFRPVMQCAVASRNADKTQARADAGWTIRLEELGGDETGFGEDADTVVFASPGLQGYSVGTAFSLSLAGSVTSSTGLPVVFTVLSGSLPAGLSMNSAGVISGTPTAYGLSVVVVRAQSGTVSATQTIPFYDSEPAVSFSGTGLQSYTAGTAYSLNLAALVDVTGSADDPVFSVVAGTLPAGLTLNTATGVVSGTPTGFGPRSVRFRASLGSGQFAEQTVAFDAPEPTVSSNGVALQDYTVGSPYILTLASLVQTTGLPPGATLSVSPIFSGSLPPGLSLTSASITGTPTAYGAYAASFTITVTGTDISTDVTVAFYAEDPAGGSDLEEAPLATGGTVIDFNDAETGLAMRALRFTASGNLAVTQQGWAEVEYHGSGGGGGFGAYGGGGGAGARVRRRVFLVPGNYPQVVPAGGAGGPSAAVDGNDGSPATGLGFSAMGGGGGASRRASGASAGRNGASGGGAALGAAGGGNPVAPSIMSDGNAGGSSAGASQSGAGGGGAGGPGTAPNKNDAGTLLGGDGGAGVVTNFDGTNRTVGAGGGGGSRLSVGPGLGGSGVGGNGGTLNTANNAVVPPTAGAANTGSGGGGAGGVAAGAAGGSGYITIRFRRL